MGKDRFQIKLLCPECGKNGIAKAVEEDGWAYVKGKTDTHISHLPDGFKIVDTPSKMASVDIHCIECNVSSIT